MGYYERTDEDVEALKSKGKVFYKFSKSSKKINNLFSEEFYKDYPEFSVVKAGAGHGLSFCDDINKLLLCIGYGDQITQVIIDEDSPYYNDIDKYLIKELEEYNRFGEYTTFTLQTGKNYSLKNPAVLNELIQKGNEDAINVFMHYTNPYGKSIEDIYEEIGFNETANFIRQIKEQYKKEIGMDSIFICDEKDTLKIKRIANDLSKNFEIPFSFEMAEKEYEKNKNRTIDRRKEPIDLIKDTEDYYSQCNSIAYYLKTNHFTNEQSNQIMKALDAANIIGDKDKINIILPHFSNEMSDIALRSLKKLFTKSNYLFEDIIKILDSMCETKYSENIKTTRSEMSLTELIADKIADRVKESFDKKTMFHKNVVDERYK